MSTQGYYLNNLVGLKFPVLHIKFQGNRSTDSGEDFFIIFLPYKGTAAILLFVSSALGGPI